MRKIYGILLPTILCLAPLTLKAQSFRVQCPPTTVTHPVETTAVVVVGGKPVDVEPPYTGPTQYTTNAQGYVTPTSHQNGAVKCQQVSGGDGLSTMANGVQTFMFAFGPLSGLADIANGFPGTEYPDVYNVPYASFLGVAPNPATTTGILLPGDPATTDGAADSGIAYTGGTGTLPGAAFKWNGAVGIVPDLDCIAGNAAAVAAPGSPLPCPNLPTNGIDGHVDPRQIIDVGVMNGNIPAPLAGFDEDDEFFLTLTNVGMIMRPDLFEQHTIHWHGYPNASSVYDGVPDASVAINIGGSFTYYYLAPDAGTYFWHCHITPPEHLQMGMVGQLYIRPRQNRVPSGGDLYNYLGLQNGVAAAFTALGFTGSPDLRTQCNPSADILCSATMPAVRNTSATARSTTNSTSGVQGLDLLGHPQRYVYNDGDGSTAYDTDYALQIHGFDPNFHFVGMTFNPEMFVDMKSKFFLLNGRSYPDTAQFGPMATQSTDGRVHYSQPLPSIIDIPVGGKAALRIADLAVDEYGTLASLGIPMKEVGFNAKLLRDQDGNNLEFYTHSITLGGGESLDVILDASDATCGSVGCASTLYPAGSIFYLYTPQLDHLSNDQENFGGMMTIVRICNIADFQGANPTCHYK
jgi:Multicopper oxidase